MLTYIVAESWMGKKNGGDVSLYGNNDAVCRQLA